MSGDSVDSSERCSERTGRGDSGNGLYQYCLEQGCDFTAAWGGGSARDDPSLPHLFENPEHTVRSGANDYHERLYQMQKSGQRDVTRDRLEVRDAE